MDVNPIPKDSDFMPLWARSQREERRRLAKWVHPPTLKARTSYKFIRQRAQERQFRAQVLREAGWTFKQIGSLLGVSSVRAAQIVGPEYWDEERGGYFHQHLGESASAAKERGRRVSE